MWGSPTVGASRRARYVPAHIINRGEQVVCRRCYRISNYGKEDQVIHIDEDDVWAMVLDVVAGSTSPHGRRHRRFRRMLRADPRSFGQRLIVAVNKVDLLPTKTPAEEAVGWVADRLAADGITHEGVYPISASEGYGVRVLFEAAKKRRGARGTSGSHRVDQCRQVDAALPLA